MLRVKSIAWAYATSVLLTIALFTFDLLLPRGTVPAVGYCACIALALGTRRRNWVIGLCISCIVLTWMALFVEPAGAPLWTSILDRSLITGVLWLIATVGLVRQSAAGQLARQREWFEFLLGSVADGVIATDQRGGILYMNTAAERATGLTADRTDSRRFSEVFRFYDDGSKHPANCPVCAVLQSRRVDGPADHLLRRASDGSEIPVSHIASPILDSRGDLLGVVLVFRDITERRLQEEALRISEERFRIALKHAPIQVCTHDRDLRYTWVYNPRSGFAVEEMLGKRDDELLPACDAAEMMEFKRSVLESGVGARQQICLNFGGQRCFYDVVAEPIRNMANDVIGLTAASMDVTELKRTQEELLRSNIELQHFASIVSHDLRSPLQSINGCAQLLHDECDGHLPGESKQLVEFIRDAGDRMNQMITSLLKYAQVDSGGVKLAPCDCEALLQTVVQDLNSKLEARGAEVTHDPLPVVLGDAPLLMRVFENLIENGTKYCSADKPRIHVSAFSGERESTFSVRDNGIGIDPKDSKRIFTMFQRLHSDESKYAGNGVGLASCQKIIERHHGRIWVESQLGRGSTFFFSIPRGALLEGSTSAALAT